MAGLITGGLSLRDMYKSFGYKPADIPRVSPPYGGRPKFVKLGSGDYGEGLPAAVFEDPRKFKPTTGKAKGQINSWGLYPYDLESEHNIPEYDVVMTYQMLYAGLGRTPAGQFVDALMERKAKELASADLQGRDKQVRNFHCYFLTDFRDGSTYGPHQSDSVDRVHMPIPGHDCLPDDKHTLAELFAKEGDQIGYLYDFGDRWYHEITVEKIFSLEESDGHVEVLSGRGRCPGENMSGNWQYHDFLHEYDVGSPAVKAAKKREVLATPNYAAFGKPPALFDPDTFAVSAAAARVADALNSVNSVRGGAKKFLMPFTSLADLGLVSQMPLGRGQRVERVADPDPDVPYGFWQETTTERKDRRAVAACAACGRPGANGETLKVCSGYKLTMYWSAEHQKAHWKTVHKRECSRKFLKK